MVCALSGQAFFFFFTLVTGPRRSLSLELSDTRVYEPQIRDRLWSSGFILPLLLTEAIEEEVLRPPFPNPGPWTLDSEPWTLNPEP